MKNLSDFISAAKHDEHVWIADVRKAFAADPSASKAFIRLDRLDGSRIEYPCPTPRWKSDDEFVFLVDYLSAEIYNIFSVYSGKAVTVFGNDSDHMLFETAFSRFFYESGYKKVINVARRLSGCTPALTHLPMSAYTPLPKSAEESRGDMSAKIEAAVGSVGRGAYCGIDVGGTDIKLAASLDGKLIAVKEYDWNPSLFRRAESIKAPVRLLARLMAACVENEKTGAAVDMSPALDRLAGHGTIERCIHAVEEHCGGIGRFDALALSFPDIVINNRIMGGETPKTAGIRADMSVDYEAELVSLSRLNDELLDIADSVSVINDGPMATFSAVCELAYSHPSSTGAVIAHSLGTDLGTGWIDSGGNIPQIPLECYDLLFDLGSNASRYLPPEDMRSLKNENSGMAGARRYLGQAAVYRLVYLSEPALIRDFVDESHGFPEIRMKPEDMRKACLAHIMEKAAGHNRTAEAAFTQIGVNLAHITEEIEYLTRANVDTRWLFGRFVKNRHCSDLIRAGFNSVIPDIELIPADDGMAATPLMKQLAGRSDVTVAQFAQAVSALYFSEYK